MNVVYKSVGDLGDIITGKTPSTANDEYWDGTIPFITPTDIVGYDMHYIYETERTVSPAGAASQKNTILPNNSICVTCIASIGKMCLTSSSKSITNQQINSIIVKTGYDYRYVFYLLRYFLPYLQMIGEGTGSGTPIISKNKFSKMKYPICENRDLQVKIADILTTYDNLIEVNNKRIKALEQMAENLYKEWFVRFRFPGHETAEFENGIPKGWVERRLGETMSFIRGVGYSSSDIANGDTVLLSMNNIRPWGGYIEDYSRVYSGKYKEDQVINEDDLIMSITDMTQDRRIIGYVGIASPSNKKRVICTHLMKITSSTYSNYFLYGLFTYSGLSRHISEYATGANVLGLTADILKRIKCRFPDKGIAALYSDKVSPVFKEIHKIEQINENLIKQRDLLLPRLMSGKLEV